MLSTSENIIMSYFNLVFLWALFYGLHSFLANLDFKHWLSTKLGKAYRGYRLVYSLFSTMFFLLIMIYGAGIEKKYLLASILRKKSLSGFLETTILNTKTRCHLYSQRSLKFNFGRSFIYLESNRINLPRQRLIFPVIPNQF
jgi:hypothetical protein